MCEAASSKPQFILKGDWKTNQRERKHSTLFLSLSFWFLLRSHGLQTNGSGVASDVTTQKINGTLVVKIKSLAAGEEALSEKYSTQFHKLSTQSGKKGI